MPDEEKERKITVAGIMSVPRLGFLDMMFCAQNVFPKLGIRLQKQTGAWWGSCLERGLEAVMEQGYDWVFVADYDSVFTLPQAVALLNLLHDHPTVDAVAPVQLKRDAEHVLFWTENSCQVRELRELELFPVKSAHFGLTLLRLDALRRMPKPWFRGSVPGPDAEHPWGDGRRDEDIDFWLRWRECGNSIMLAPQIAIGHLEMFVMWPGQDFNPVFQHPNNFWSDGIPDEAWGTVGKREDKSDEVPSSDATD